MSKTSVTLLALLGAAALAVILHAFRESPSGRPLYLGGGEAPTEPADVRPIPISALEAPDVPQRAPIAPGDTTAPTQEVGFRPESFSDDEYRQLMEVREHMLQLRLALEDEYRLATRDMRLVDLLNVKDGDPSGSLEYALEVSMPSGRKEIANLRAELGALMEHELVLRARKERGSRVREILAGKIGR